MNSFLSEYLVLFVNLTLPGFFYLLGVVFLLQAYTDIDIIKKVKKKKNNKFLIYISILVVVFSFIIGFMAHLALQEVKSLIDNGHPQSQKAPEQFNNVYGFIIFIFDNGHPQSQKVPEQFNNVYGVLLMIRHLLISIPFLVFSIAIYFKKTNKRLNNKGFFTLMYFILIVILSFAYFKIRSILIEWSEGDSISWIWLAGSFLLLFSISLIRILTVKSREKNS